METAKAVVEVPSPVSGKVLKLAGGAGDVIVTGTMLAEFEIDPTLPQRAEGQDTGHHHGRRRRAPARTVAGASDKVVASDEGGVIDETDQTKTESAREDSGTVVGAMQRAMRVRSEAAIAVGGVKAMPAVRALAQKLGVDIARVRGDAAPDGVVTMAGREAARRPMGRRSVGAAPAHARPRLPAAGAGAPAAPAPAQRDARCPQPASRCARSRRACRPSGQPEQLKGVRRNMARVMADAHAKVVPTTLSDDADIHAWAPGNDITGRLVRAIVAACKAVPALNAWFDGDNAHAHAASARRHRHRGRHRRRPVRARAAQRRHARRARRARSASTACARRSKTARIPPSELTGYTISLSNFGMFAGRYATPVVVPPMRGDRRRGQGPPPDDAGDGRLRIAQASCRCR